MPNLKDEISRIRLEDIGKRIMILCILGNVISLSTIFKRTRKTRAVFDIDTLNILGSFLRPHLPNIPHACVPITVSMCPFCPCRRPCKRVSNKDGNVFAQGTQNCQSFAKPQMQSYLTLPARHLSHVRCAQKRTSLQNTRGSVAVQKVSEDPSPSINLFTAFSPLLVCVSRFRPPSLPPPFRCV